VGAGVVLVGSRVRSKWGVVYEVGTDEEALVWVWGRWRLRQGELTRVWRRLFSSAVAIRLSCYCPRVEPSG
jgi:hypothetical protein